MHLRCDFKCYYIFRVLTDVIIKNWVIRFFQHSDSYIINVHLHKMRVRTLVQFSKKCQDNILFFTN